MWGPYVDAENNLNWIAYKDSTFLEFPIAFDMQEANIIYVFEFPISFDMQKDKHHPLH